MYFLQDFKALYKYCIIIIIIIITNLKDILHSATKNILDCH